MFTRDRPLAVPRRGVMQRAVLAGGLMVLAVLAGCAAGPPYTNWAASTTKNVTVYTEAKLEHEYMQEWLELAHAAYAAFFPGVDTGHVEAVWLKREPGS